MCSCSDTGNKQLPYNSPGDYLVHVLIPNLYFFQLTAQGGVPENPGTSYGFLSSKFCLL